MVLSTVNLAARRSQEPNMREKKIKLRRAVADMLCYAQHIGNGPICQGLFRNPESRHHAIGVCGSIHACFPSDRYHAEEENRALASGARINPLRPELN